MCESLRMAHIHRVECFEIYLELESEWVLVCVCVCLCAVDHIFSISIRFTLFRECAVIIFRRLFILTEMECENTYDYFQRAPNNVWFSLFLPMSGFDDVAFYSNDITCEWNAISTCFSIHPTNIVLAMKHLQIISYTNRLLKRKNYCLRCESRREIKWIECTLAHSSCLPLSLTCTLFLHCALSCIALQNCDKCRKEMGKVNKLWHFVVSKK